MFVLPKKQKRPCQQFGKVSFEILAGIYFLFRMRLEHFNSDKSVIIS